ncbi:hypothetical protein EJD97_007266 [Solanum chilense]|uniref:Tf2-1-like SH3-like domain-containing protein n=1 Tax=Solanum chilense TaxID=4083 RepID=A0A6N2CA83_SOLCI|nr:hypothetical protein EJD97_007266 [Solanum chilense]
MAQDITTQAQVVTTQDQVMMTLANREGRGTSLTRKKPTCGKCCKKHYGDCLVEMDNCFGYGKSGHKVRDHPNLKGQDKGSGQAQASNFNMDPPKKNHFYALHSRGEQESSLDVVTDNNPISIPPYRMAPAEFKELKAHLNDLQDKGFIRTSIYPWGAPVGRLGVRFEDCPNGGFMVHQNSGSSLVIEVKSKQHVDQTLMQLKESILCFPQTQNQYDSVWVIVDRLTKFSHFIPVKSTYLAKDYARIFKDEIVSCHGIPLSIISNRGAQFHLGLEGHSKKGWVPRRVFTLGPDLIYKTLEKVHIIGNRLKKTYSRQKSFADHRRRELQFEEGDKVYLTILPMKGVVRFVKKEKLSPHYMGPYENFQKICKVVYELKLPSELTLVHQVFHVSLLKKCIGDFESILPIECLGFQKNLSYEEVPIKIFNIQLKKLRNKEAASVKVLWKNHLV